MDGKPMIGRLEGGAAIAVTTCSPFLCVAGDTPALALAAVDRALAFHRRSAKPRPIPAGAIGKPDFVRPARAEA